MWSDWPPIRELGFKCHRDWQVDVGNAMAGTTRERFREVCTRAPADLLERYLDEVFAEAKREQQARIQAWR